MSIWAIADVHASPSDTRTGRPTKPMDIFGPQWADHIARLEQAWMSTVDQRDTVIIAGDIDWSLRLDDAHETLQRIGSWPGTKILIRGNHDYWWSSKTTNRVRRELPESMHALHNNALQAEGFNICGSKGSPVPGGIDWTDENAKLLNRELARLDHSLAARDPSLETIVVLHYPPFYPPVPESPYTALLTRCAARACIYGHLHGDAAKAGPRGNHRGIEYVLVSGDAVRFQPVLIAREGRIMTYSARQS